MVFLYNQVQPISTGLVAFRNTGLYTGQLIFESMSGLFVAISNVVIIFALIIGWRTLTKNKFYIILANLLICTSLKSIVELLFIVPYYVLQSDGIRKEYGYFTHKYELLFFNVSVLADYGVLFFSILIAINRFLTVSQIIGSPSIACRPGTEAVLSCALAWIFTLIIPALFYLFNCQYVYDSNARIYINDCFITKGEFLEFLLFCLIYLSYACAVAVFVLYLLIYLQLRKRQTLMHFAEVRASMAKTQLQLLRQSVIVFVLYAASILCVFALSFVPRDHKGTILSFDIAYVENLLNLSIAAAYPICFLTMSGEMKSILIRSVVPRRWFSSSILVSSSSG